MTCKQSYSALAACVLDCASPLALSFCSVSAISNLFVSSLLKANQAFPRLLKPFFKNPFFIALQPGPFNCNFRRRLSVAYVNLCKAMSTYVNDPPGAISYPLAMDAKLSSITNHRPCHSPSPGGEGRGEGELNLRGPRAALIFILTPDFWILNSGIEQTFK
jgi:hypothetical protein